MTRFQQNLCLKQSMCDIYNEFKKRKEVYSTWVGGREKLLKKTTRTMYVRTYVRIANFNRIISTDKMTPGHIIGSVLIIVAIGSFYLFSLTSVYSYVSRQFSCGVIENFSIFFSASFERKLFLICEQQFRFAFYFWILLKL